MDNPLLTKRLFVLCFGLMRIELMYSDETDNFDHFRFIHCHIVIDCGGTATIMYIIAQIFV